MDIKYIFRIHKTNKFKIEKLNWEMLSKNINDRAIELLKQNSTNNIDWDWLSQNTSDGAIELLKQNQDKICWDWLFWNSNIFE